jgi:hypothetical protein
MMHLKSSRTQSSMVAKWRLLMVLYKLVATGVVLMLLTVHVLCHASVLLLLLPDMEWW